VRPTVTVLPSPFLPGAAYRSLVAEFTRRGVRATLADPTLGPGADPATLVERWSRATHDADALLAHSNAGLLAPLVRSRADVGHRVVFMDAALLPDEGSAALAPPGLRAMLAGRADPDGLLPAWTRWWEAGTLTDVIPADLLDEIDRSCPRLPLSYLDHVVQAPSGWTGLDNAYLAFGDTYAVEHRRARRHGWPTAAVAGGHLYFLHEPDRVVTTVLDLVGCSP
jgi:hypothetical protein